jgi:hypothetical protein
MATIFEMQFLLSCFGSLPWATGDQSTQIWISGLCGCPKEIFEREVLLKSFWRSSSICHHNYVNSSNEYLDLRLVATKTRVFWFFINRLFFGLERIFLISLCVYWTVTISSLRISLILVFNDRVIPPGFHKGVCFFIRVMKYIPYRSTAHIGGNPNIAIHDQIWPLREVRSALERWQLNVCSLSRPDRASSSAAWIITWALMPPLLLPSFLGLPALWDVFWQTIDG